MKRDRLGCEGAVSYPDGDVSRYWVEGETVAGVERVDGWRVVRERQPRVISAGMRVNVAVCGVFHHRKYIGELSKRGVLAAFYYSHRRATDAAALGMLPERDGGGRAENLWAKEYLYRGVSKVLGGKMAERIGPMTHDLWEGQMMRRWAECDVFHLMLHGTGLNALRMAKRKGTRTLGEPVNAHPLVLGRMMEAEHRLLGIAPPPPMRKSERRLVEEISECDALLVASAWIKRSFVEEGYPADKIHVLPYATDPVHFFPLTAEEKAKAVGSDRRFRVLCVAQLVPRKGQHHLLEAWKRLALPADEAELVIVGRMSAEMQGVMEKYRGLYTYLPSVAHEALRFEYGRADVFVLPSVEDGFGLVAVEAMGCGVPVITTTNAGVADVVEDGRSGFVVPAGSPDALADRIGRMFRDRSLGAAMGARSLELSRTTLSWGQYVDGLVEIYRKMTGG